MFLSTTHLFAEVAIIKQINHAFVGFFLQCLKHYSSIYGLINNQLIRYNRALLFLVYSTDHRYAYISNELFKSGSPQLSNGPSFYKQFCFIRTRNSSFLFKQVLNNKLNAVKLQLLCV